MNGNLYRNEYVTIRNVTCYYDALGKLSGPDSGIHENLYHYTSTTVLNAILSTGIFRASNLFYLNDEIEYKQGVNVLRKIFTADSVILHYLDEIEDADGKSWAGIFSISFSNKQDELQQWITYAKESGVCIELDQEIIWGTGSDDELYLAIEHDKRDAIKIQNKCFLKLAYDAAADMTDGNLPQLDAAKIRGAFADAVYHIENDDDRGTLDEAKVDEIWKSHEKEAKEFLQLLASYYKEERFRGEGEIRAAFPAVYSTYKTGTDIFYFERPNGILRPYINVYFQHCYHITNEYKTECPIKSILVGPSGTQDKVFNSIVHRLKYGECKVWNYNDVQMGKRLSEYISGCVFAEKLNPEDYIVVVDHLAREWCNHNDFRFHVLSATASKIEIEVERNSSKSNDPKVYDTEYAVRILERYKENNYLSGHGVWVKKSSLPYNF